jgi:hypothetical protein
MYCIAETTEGLTADFFNYGESQKKAYELLLYSL